MSNSSDGGSARNRSGRRKNRNRPTMHDVADRAGVSQMTVSRVLRGDGYQSTDVRNKVMKACEELGYIQNRMASVQRGTQNPMVGVVLPTLKNAVFLDVLAGINDTLAKHNVRPVFGVSEYSLQEEEKLISDFMSWQPQGLILAGLDHSDRLRKLLTNSSLRVAEVMDVEGEPVSACYGISQQTAGADMAQHFLEKGYKRVAYIGSQGTQDLRAQKRYHSFAKTLRAGGGEIVFERIAKRPSSMLLGRELTAECLASQNDIQAIYYSNDDKAAGGLMHCLANNINVPNDLALAGFNGLPFVEALPLRITTTLTPRYEMGAAAAEYVAQTEEGTSTPNHIAFDAPLIIGDTT